MISDRENQLEKITMIGPVYPYKSGIAHYTGLLCKALRKKYDVEMISYKMQYPKILFRQEQRDDSGKLFQVDDVKYWIHTANPFNIIRSAERIKKQNPDIVILQWWHPYFAPCYLLLLAGFKKVPVFFICHNVFPHSRFLMDRKLTKWALKKGNGFIVQSKSDETDLKSILPECQCITAVHPTYDNFKYLKLTKQQARERLSVAGEKKVLLFFGFVKEYKGLRHLLYAMPELCREAADIMLLIAGEFDQDKQEYIELIERLGIKNSVVIIDRFIPDEEVELYFAACDLVILPYESATQSGIVQMAYGFERPVVVTRVGGLPDVVSDGKTGYVVSPHCSEEIARAVLRYYAEERADEFEENIRQEARRFSWDRMVEHIESLWSEMGCGRSKR